MPLARLLACCLLLLAVCACKNEAEPAITPQTTDKHQAKRIALVMKTMSNPFFVEIEKGARRAEKEFGLHLLTRAAASETSIEQQIQLVETLITQKVDAIVIAPGDSQRLIPVLKRAQLAGIKLVNIDNQLNQDAMSRARMEPIPFVSVDNEDASYRAVRLLSQKINRPTKAAILEGIRSAENAQLRLRGARRAFSENTHISLVAAESANWKIDEAYQVAAQLFKDHPDLRLLFCANDMMALGVLRYLHDHDIKHVQIASYDALEDIKIAIKAGQVSVTVDQQAMQQGFQGIALAHRLLKGELVPKQVWVDARLISAEQLQ